MKRGLLLILFLMPMAICAKDGGKSHPVRKVDTTPNTDDSDIWSFAVESNTYADTVYLNPTLDFSATDGWDVQLASYNIPVYHGGAQNYEWDSYINLSKTIDINQEIKAVIGTQNGTTTFNTQRKWHNIDYALISYQPWAMLSLRAGPYWANKNLSTTTDVLGFTAGFNLNFSQDFYIQADYFSGHSNVSGATVNAWYRWAYAGVGVPETDSGNEFYGTVGVKLNFSEMQF